MGRVLFYRLALLAWIVATHTWNDTLSAISFSFKQMNNKQPSCGSLHVDNCVETIQPTVCTQVCFFWNMGLSEKGRSKVKAQQPNTAINWYGGDEPPYVTIKTWIYRAKLGYPDAPWCWYVYLHLDDVWGKCWYIFHICGAYGIGCHTSVWIVYVNASSPLKLESLVKVRWRSERLCFTMNHVSFQQDWTFHLKPQIKPPKKGDIVI